MLFFLIRSKVFMSLYKIPQWLVSNHQNPSAATLKFTFSEMYGSSRRKFNIFISIPYLQCGGLD